MKVASALELAGECHDRVFTESRRTADLQTDRRPLTNPHGIAMVARRMSLVSVETGEKRRLTHRAPWDDDLSPAMSSDMKHLVFARYRGGEYLYALDLSRNLQPLGDRNN